MTDKYIIDKVSSVHDRNLKFGRVGIIPYFLFEVDFYFIMMKDACYQELTDAGGYSRKKESWIKTASRELYEETRGLFCYTIDQIKKLGVIVYASNQDIAIIFMPEYYLTPETAYNRCINYKFSYMLGISNNDRKEFLENSDMMIFTLKDLTKITLKGRLEVYRPVRFLLRYFCKNLLKDFFFLYLN